MPLTRTRLRRGDFRTNPRAVTPTRRKPGTRPGVRARSVPAGPTVTGSAEAAAAARSWGRRREVRAAAEGSRGRRGNGRSGAPGKSGVDAVAPGAALR